MRIRAKEIRRERKREAEHIRAEIKAAKATSKANPRPVAARPTRPAPTAKTTAPAPKPASAPRAPRPKPAPVEAPPQE